MANLAAYIVRRLILLVFVLLGVTILVFAVTQLLPINIRALLYVRSLQGKSVQDAINVVIGTYHLNDPFYVQYVRWLGQVLTGNLGFSESAMQTVTDSIATKWPLTFEIVIFAAPLIIFIGIYLGVQSAIHRNGPIDQGSRVLSIIGWSLPSFWVGMLLLAIFGQSGIFGWFPAGSITMDPWQNLYQSHMVHFTNIPLIDGLLNGYPGMTVDVLFHCVLPVATVVIIDVALLIRVMRSSMLETLNKPYITTARAKGLSNKVVIYKHARRNALIPVATLSGMLVAGLLTGLIITETVFGFGGLGQWAARAASQLDIPAVLGYTILTALLFVIANLIVDILYAYIDPRIRLD